MKLTHMSGWKKFNDSTTIWHLPGEPQVTLSIKKKKKKITAPQCLMWIAASCRNTQGVFNICVNFQQAF